MSLLSDMFVYDEYINNIIIINCTFEVAIERGHLGDNRCFFYIIPNALHSDYWNRFKSKFKNWHEVAEKHKIIDREHSCCPEFGSPEDLCSWFDEVTGAHTLLLLTFGEINICDVCRD